MTVLNREQVANWRAWAERMGYSAYTEDLLDTIDALQAKLDSLQPETSAATA